MPDLLENQIKGWYILIDGQSHHEGTILNKNKTTARATVPQPQEAYRKNTGRRKNSIADQGYNSLYQPRLHIN